MKYLFLITVVLSMMFAFNGVGLHAQTQPDVKTFKKNTNTSLRISKKNMKKSYKKTGKKVGKKVNTKREKFANPDGYDILNKGNLFTINKSEDTKDSTLRASRKLDSVVLENIPTLVTYHINSDELTGDTLFQHGIFETIDTQIIRKNIFWRNTLISKKSISIKLFTLEKYLPRHSQIFDTLPTNVDRIYTTKSIPEISKLQIYSFQKNPIISDEEYINSIDMSEVAKQQAIKSIEFDTCGCEHLRFQYNEYDRLIRVAMLDPFKIKCAAWKGYQISRVTVDAQLKVFTGESRFFAQAKSSSNMLFYNGAGREVFKDAGLDRDSASRNLNPYEIIVTLAHIDKKRLNYNKHLKSKIDKGEDIEFEHYGPFNMAPSVCNGKKNHVIYKRGSIEYANNKGVDIRGDNNGNITEGEILQFYRNEYIKVMNKYLPEYERVAYQTDSINKRAKVAGINLKRNKNLDDTMALLARRTHSF